MKSINHTYTDRLKTLIRRRDFLLTRIANYHGKDDSRDRAEAAALSWAIATIESDPESAVERIKSEKAR